MDELKLFATSVDLAPYGVSRAKDWVSADCGTSFFQWMDELRIFTALSTVFQSLWNR